MLKHTLISIALLLGCGPHALAQNDHPLSERVADTLRSREPTWVLKDAPGSGVYSEHCKCEMSSLEWRHARSPVGGVLVFVYAHESGGGARATYESLAEDWALEKVNDLSRPDLGIEQLKARAGEFKGVKYSLLLFRRGRVAVVLWGLDTESGVAERFASVIAAALPAA